MLKFKKFALNEAKTIKVSFHSAAAKAKWMKKQSIDPKEIISQTKNMLELPASMKQYVQPKDHDEIYSMSMKEEVELDEAFKKGDSVTVKNARKYDALSKPEVSGTVIGMNGNKVMVKVGSGQMNVDPKDLMKKEVELDEISAKLARSARDKAKASELDYKIKAYNKISKTKNIPVISKLGKKAAEPDIKMADRRKRQANLANRKLGGMGDYEYDGKGKYRRQGPAKVLAKEEVDLDEVKVKNSDAAMDLEKEISALEKRISKLTPLARKDDDANMQLIRAKNRLKQKQEKYKQLMKESVELGEATDFRAGDTVHEVGSKLKGTVQHKGNRDLIAVKFGSVNQMIPAGRLRLAEESELDEVKMKNSEAAQKLKNEIQTLERSISKLTPLAQKATPASDGANMRLISAKSRLKKKQEKYNQLMKESVELGEALPPHLQKLLDKNGNLDPKKVAKLVKFRGSRGRTKVTDVTPKGYGPKEEVELDEAKLSVGDRVTLQPNKNTLDRSLIGKAGVVTGMVGSKPTVKFANGQTIVVSPNDLKLNESVELSEAFTPKDVKMAIGIASDKRYAGGNMTGAVSAIEKVKKGLSDHPQVQAVLKRQNESVELDELDSKTYRSYHDKATADQLKRMDKAKQTDKDRHTMRKRSLGIATAGMKQYGDKRTVKQWVRGEEVELGEAGSPDRLAIIKKAAQRVKERQAAADKKAAAAAKRDMKAKGAQRGMAPLKKDLDEKSRSFPFQGSNDHAPKNIFQPPFGSRKNMGQVTFLDKDGKQYNPVSKSKSTRREMASYKKDLDEGRNEALKALEALVKNGGIDKANFQKAHDLYKANKLNDLRKHIYSLDTDPGEEIVRAFNRKDSKAFNSMYPRAKPGDYFRKIIDDHGGK